MPVRSAKGLLGNLEPAANCGVVAGLLARFDWKIYQTSMLYSDENPLKACLSRWSAMYMKNHL